MTPGKVENVFYIVRSFMNLVSDYPYNLSPSPCMMMYVMPAEGLQANSFGEGGGGLMQHPHSTVSSDCEVMSVYICMYVISVYICKYVISVYICMYVMSVYICMYVISVYICMYVMSVYICM